jgi:hypothetical protein
MVVVCDSRAWRFKSQLEAQHELGEQCGFRRCLDIQRHRLIELADESQPVVVGRCREIGWE